MADEPIHETKTEARAGSSGYNKWVLLASLILIVAAFATIVGIGFR